MNSVTRIGLAFLLWMTALYGVLQLNEVSSLNTHDICGPWGCGPPTSALLAWHGFWLVFAAPLVGMVVRYCPPHWVKCVGLMLTGGGLTALIGIGIWQAVTWLPKVVEGQPTYFAQRYLFSVVTLVDLPVISGLVAGLATLVLSRVKHMQRTTTGAEPLGKSTGAADVVPPAASF